MLNVFEHCELLKDKDNTLTSNNGDLTKANGLQRASTVPKDVNWSYTPRWSTAVKMEYVSKNASKRPEICVVLNGVIAKLYQGNLRHRFPSSIPWSLDGVSTFFLGSPCVTPRFQPLDHVRYFSFGICRAFNVTFGQVPEQGPGTESHWLLFGSQNSEFFSDYPLGNIQKAIENCHRNDWLINNGDFPQLC